MSKWWPFGRKKEVQKSGRRAYAAAAQNRLVAGWMAQSTSIDSEIRGSLKALRNRARALGRDNDYAKQALRTVTNNVVGEGMVLQSQVKMQRGGKLDERTNSLIEMEWKKWARRKNCHTAGLLSFSDIERLAVRSLAESGEILIRTVMRPFGDSKIPLGLEVIESDLLDDDLNGMADNGNRIRMGVEIDIWGRPVAYHFHARHPGDYNLPNQATEVRRNQHDRIPASEIIHLFITERPGQTRGVSWFASTIMRLHQMQGYEEAETIAARASASLMGFIESEEGELRGDDVQDDQRVTEFEPGVFKQLNPGERVNVPNISRPGSTFDPFIRSMLRGAAAGIGASYESISRDYSQSNYSSTRQALVEDRDNWRVLQKWLIEAFHQPVFEKWVDMANLAGVLNLPRFDVAPELYNMPRWIPRGWSWVDPTKEVTAYKDAVRSGFMTVSDVIAQGGGDIEETFANREREIQMAADKGLIFDTDPKMVSNAGLTQGRPAGTALPSTEETEPGDPNSRPAASFSEDT